MGKKALLLPLGVALLWGVNQIESNTTIHGKVVVEGEGNRVQIGGVNLPKGTPPAGGKNVVIVNGDVKVVGKGKKIVIPSSTYHRNSPPPPSPAPSLPPAPNLSKPSPSNQSTSQFKKMEKKMEKGLEELEKMFK